MPAAIPIAIAVTAASAIYSGVEANQERQHAKGAAQAQETADNAQLKAANDLDLSKQKQAADLAAASASANSNALNRVMNARKRATILTDPNSNEAAPIATKTLLGA